MWTVAAGHVSLPIYFVLGGNALTEQGERLVAWQWMGLLAEWLGMWPVVDGGDRLISTFPTMPFPVCPQIFC